MEKFSWVSQVKACEPHTYFSRVTQVQVSSFTWHLKAPTRPGPPVVPCAGHFPGVAASTGQPLLTAGKKFSIPSCEVRFLPKWSILFHNTKLCFLLDYRWERKIPMKIKKPLPAQNQWTNQSTKTQKNYVAWTFSGCFFFFFFEKILDWQIRDTEGKIMTISLSSRHL